MTEWRALTDVAPITLMTPTRDSANSTIGRSDPRHSDLRGLSRPTGVRSRVTV